MLTNFWWPRSIQEEGDHINVLSLSPYLSRNPCATFPQIGPKYVQTLEASPSVTRYESDIPKIWCLIYFDMNITKRNI